MWIPTRPRLPDGDCVFISDCSIVARADASHIAADVAQLGHAFAYCLPGFESLIKFEFRNQEGEHERKT